LTALTDTVSRPLTLSDAWLPTRSHALLRDALLVLGASAFITLCAQIAIPLPWTPVPVTGQTFGILLAGVLLGGRRGALACLTYLAQGAAGLPVFAGGMSGFASFVGPTAGYLVAFPIAAFLVGSLAERGMDRKPQTALVAMLLGSLVILLLGSLRLSALLGDMAVGFSKGFAPFVIGELGKAGAAALLLPLAWRVSKHSL
jgi:biotin transport system substrate-specific component